MVWRTVLLLIVAPSVLTSRCGDSHWASLPGSRDGSLSVLSRPSLGYPSDVAVDMVKQIT